MLTTVISQTHAPPIARARSTVLRSDRTHAPRSATIRDENAPTSSAPDQARSQRGSIHTAVASTTTPARVTSAAHHWLPGSTVGFHRYAWPTMTVRVPNTAQMVRAVHVAMYQPPS